jgi:hypothetical protein
MSLLINGKQLTVGVALRDENHEMHPYAVEYTAGMAELRQKFGKVIKFVRPGYPRTNIGTDSRGREAHMLEPTPPAMFPLEKEHAHPLRGKEIWSCCLNMPKLLPNGLWSIGNKKSIKITEFLNVDLDRQPDLAYYLYYIANFERGGRLKVDDPKADIKAKADKKMREVERTTAIWQMLDDEHKLRTMAAAYGVPNSGTKEPDQLKFDLEAQLEINDNRKRQDPLIKGTREFLEEMKVTDNVRLRAFIKNLEDTKKLIYKPDGRYHLGDKTLLQVPFESIKDTFGYICSYYNVPNNAEKLQDLMRDVVNKEYLDNIKDEKDFTWLAKVMGINTPFKKKEELRSMVYDAFSIAL